jgi:hypothetical protein
VIQPFLKEGNTHTEGSQARRRRPRGMLDGPCAQSKKYL